MVQEAWINVVSTRKVDELVQVLGMTDLSKSQVSELCKGIDKVFSATWPRCRVHFMRNDLACVPKSHQALAGIVIHQVFLQPDADSAHDSWRQVADKLRPMFGKVASVMDEAEHGMLAYLDLAAHRVKVHSTNTPERLNKEIKRRANVVGAFPNEGSIRRLIGAVLMEQNEE